MYLIIHSLVDNILFYLFRICFEKYRDIMRLGTRGVLIIQDWQIRLSALNIDNSNCIDLHNGVHVRK